ncbi:MAG: hypothetical protein AB1631_26095 [Acidobacteriota bacterium]
MIRVGSVLKEMIIVIVANLGQEARKLITAILRVELDAPPPSPKADVVMKQISLSKLVDWLQMHGKKIDDLQYEVKFFRLK